MTRPMKRSLLLSLGLALLASALPSAAEVSAIYDPTVDLAPTGILIAGVTDDPDPLNAIWLTVGAPRPNRHPLNPGGAANGDGKPSILLRSDQGDAVAVWAKNGPGGFDIVLSHFIGGAWSEPVVIAGEAWDELDPYLLRDRVTGSIHLFYWTDDAVPRVMWRAAPADLSSWSSPIVVSLPGEPALRPSATWDAGTLGVAYEAHDQGAGSVPRRIVLATWQGSTFTHDLVSVTGHAEANWPEVHAREGLVWVDWIDAEGTMGWTRRPLGSGWESVEGEPFATPLERDYHVRGAISVQAVP